MTNISCIFLFAETAMDKSRMLEIPVWVDNTQKWLSGLSKRTTCDDIIYAILYNENRHETDNTDSYAIFERWKGVEKALQGRTKILRVWRNWASEQANVRFVMRRIDDIVTSGEYLITKRRYKRWRHKRRYEHCCSQQNMCQGHGYDCTAQKQGSSLPCQCNSCRHVCPSGKSIGLTKSGEALDHDKLRRLQKLIRSVMMQEKKVKSMADRLEETELLIEKYEAKIHFHRTRKKGINYVQRSLLHDSTSTSEDSLDEFINKANIDLLDEYVEACDKLINVWESIITEENTIEKLMSLIRQHGIEPCTALPECNQYCNIERTKNRGLRLESEVSEEDWMIAWNRSASTLDDMTEPEIEAVNREFNRVMTLSVIQNITAEQLDKEMKKYERQMAEKGSLISSLEHELKLVETEEPIAKTLQESDSSDHFESRVIAPEDSRILVDNGDFEVTVVDLQERSSSLGTCPKSETECIIDNTVLDVKNALSTNGSTESILPKNETEYHLKNNSNDVVYNKSTVNTKTNTNISNNNKQLVSHRKGPRVGIVGGALRSDFSRTKSKRDWLTVLPSLDKNGSKETPLYSELSQTDLTTQASNLKSNTDKNRGNEIRDQSPADTTLCIKQQPHSFVSQRQAISEEEVVENSHLALSFLDNSQLLVTSNSGASASCPIFKLDKSDDTDSTSDTGLGSMNSDEFNNIPIETLV